MKVSIIATLLMTSLNSYAADDSSVCRAAIEKVGNAGMVFGHISERSLHSKSSASPAEATSISLQFGERLDELKTALREARSLCKDAQ